MRFIKRLLRILVLVVLLGAIGVGVMYHLSTRTPGRYLPHFLSAKERDAAAWRLEHEKLPNLLNLAERSQKQDSAAQRARERGTVVPPDATQPVAPVTLSFTQDEINSFLWKWSQPYEGNYKQYVTHPFIALEEGSIVLMATVPEFDRVVSAFFEPKLDEKGMLHSDLASLKLGAMPLPQALFSSKREKVENALRSRLPNWQNRAKIDSTGLANSDAQSAWLGKLVLQLLNRQPSPAVIFVHTEKSNAVPVRLTNVTVEKGTLSITVQPMDAAERAALLEQIREPQSAAAGTGTASVELPRN
ncbi:MAG: hypothetical protein JWN40_5369 [Phycisphaerales bacterium]|nr:hypothetical protein [Phycisphaerales bacterium]